MQDAWGCSAPPAAARKRRNDPRPRARWKLMAVEEEPIVRLGQPGHEKPAVLVDGVRLSISKFGKDYNEALSAADGMVAGKSSWPNMAAHVLLGTGMPLVSQGRRRLSGPEFRSPRPESRAIPRNLESTDVPERGSRLSMSTRSRALKRGDSKSYLGRGSRRSPVVVISDSVIWEEGT